MATESGESTEDEDWQTATGGASVSIAGSDADMASESRSLPPQCFRAGNRPHEKDMFIAVMGMSGAGKSTFISHFIDSDKSPEIGGGLQNCTQRMVSYRCDFVNARMNLYLVDTPSFDNTTRTDAEVLDEMAQWLAGAFASGIKLSGILYLRRITEARVRFSELTSLELFWKLCGPKAFRSVFLVSTMCERAATPHEIESVENELATTHEFWGRMEKQGAAIKRHDNTKSSAAKLIKELAAMEEDDLVLDIQDEMVHGGKAWGQTSAAKVVECEFAKQGKLSTMGPAGDDTDTMREAFQGPREESATAALHSMQQQHLETQQVLQRLVCQQEELVASVRTIAEAGKEHGDKMGELEGLLRGQQGPPRANEQRYKTRSRPPPDNELPLCCAAEGGHYDDVRRMLEQGADPAMCGARGWTALHWAAANGRTDIVRLLLRHSAPVNAASNTGVKPLNMAKTNEIMTLLLENGATY